MTASTGAILHAHPPRRGHGSGPRDGGTRRGAAASTRRGCRSAAGWSTCRGGSAARVEGRAHLATDTDRRLRHAVEARHESFRDPVFRALLREHGVALVVADSAGTWPVFR
ncbi:DUF72 domain-containing protein [Pseudonocardia abyssalis]|uniref:DUF72 domain-containing protein n=1 Tax=Pseudonocardia abyssalis TaxID=2792008 RepID=UPI003556D500